MILSVVLSDHQMMTRPLSAVGYKRPLSHHSRVAMMMKPDIRYKVSLLSIHLFTFIQPKGHTF